MINIHSRRVRIAAAAILMLGLLGLGIARYFFHARNNESGEPIPIVRSGEYLTWAEVDELFLKYDKANIIDLDSGLIFRVQRRAGSHHADVQPLTATDTAVMKLAYGGKWSWQRRAAILELDNGRRIAASMAGMPHGQGAIQGNNFNGHFCLHFKDSKIHKSRKVDLAHQMMVWKAANRWKEELEALTPNQIIAVFFTAADQHETNMVSSLIETEDSEQLALSDFTKLQTVKAENIKQAAPDKFTVDVRVTYIGSSQEYRNQLDLTVVKSGSYWKIKSESIRGWLSGNIKTEVQAVTDGRTYEEDWETEDNM